MKIKDFPQAVINENVDYTVKEITSVIKRYGPRESGNKNCLATAAIFVWSNVGYEAHNGIFL